MKRLRFDSFFRTFLQLETEEEVPFFYLEYHERLLSSLWSLRMDNHVKETYWRLFLNALPLGSRMGDRQPPCRCSLAGLPAAQQDRWHTFWACPLAKQLRALVEEVLGRVRPDFSLTPSHLLLMHLPFKSPLLPRVVWYAVCLAAVHALDRGRAFLYLPRADPLTDYLHVVERGQYLVRAKFHQTLCHFCASGRLPKAVYGRLQKDGLFVRREGKRLTVSLPAVPLPPDWEEEEGEVVF